MFRGKRRYPIGIDGDIVLVEVTDGWCVGVGLVFEGVSDEGESLDGMRSGVDQIYSHQIGGLADVGIAITRHRVEREIEAHVDIVEEGVECDGIGAVSLADERWAQLAEVQFLESLDKSGVVDIDMSQAELVRTQILVQKVVEVLV